MRQESEWLVGVVQRARPGQVWVYRKPDSLWTILKVCPEGSQRSVTVKGVVKFEPRHGDRLKMAGTWKKSDFNGEDEFSFYSVALQIPDDARGLLEYVALITAGIGPVIRQQIWDAYGEDWPSHPHLEGITGLSATTCSNWAESLRRIENEKAKASAMSFLLAKCCSITMANKAWDAWSEDVTGRVTADPYCLCELPRVGFLTVENAGIPRAFGIEDDDPRRMRAAVLYAMEDVTRQLGTLVAIRDLCEHATLARLDDAAAQAVHELVDRGDLVAIGDAVARKADYEAESRVAEYAT
jgi:hypothetical protein